jgi:cytochrome P450
MHALSLPRYLPTQARLHRELMSNLSTPVDQLPYLDAVVKEGLRCFPPIPMSFPRYVPTGGRSIDGVWVPEGTIVSCQPHTLHKDEVVFPRALEFVPERWLESKGTKEREEMFFAFSKGSRGCLGKKYVLKN